MLLFAEENTDGTLFAMNQLARRDFTLFHPQPPLTSDCAHTLPWRAHSTVGVPSSIDIINPDEADY
jgi:hypothetical protein